MTRLPDFLFIGPDKSGSSWLFTLLSNHPHCFVPPCKDIYFFDRYYQRGLDWYAGFFSQAPGQARAVGELSHDYLFSPRAAARIHRDLPRVRLLTCLRNPVERSFSHYLYLVRSGLTRLPFTEALDRHPEILDHSLYHRHLRLYLELFDRPQLQVLLFEDLQRDATAFARQITDFLELSHLPEAVPAEVVRPASRPRSHHLARLMKCGADLARDAGLAGLVGRVKHSPLTGLLYHSFTPQDRPRLDEATRRLLWQHCRDDVMALESALGLDLAHWRPTGQTSAPDRDTRMMI